MTNRNYLKIGIIDGLPIALGYLAVSFSLGIQARKAGIGAIYATLMSLLNLTSAGEFAAIGIIAAGGSFLEMAVSTLIINLRYMLMSCALSQKIDMEKPFFHRFLIAGGITDEIFGISIAAKDRLNPFYTYGAMLVAIPGWALGTCLGVIFGNILPTIVVNAMSIALYGMFIAIVIPPAKKHLSVAVAVVLSMFSSYIFSKLDALSKISDGTKVVILTVVISLLFAIICPITEDDEKGDKKDV